MSNLLQFEDEENSEYNIPIIDEDPIFIVRSNVIKEDEVRQKKVTMLKLAEKEFERYSKMGMEERKLVEIESFLIKEERLKPKVNEYLIKKKRPQRKDDTTILEDLTPEELDEKLFSKHKTIITTNGVRRTYINIYPPFNEDWDILETAINSYPVRWKDFFSVALVELAHTNRQVLNIEKNHGKSIPDRSDIFRCFELCDPDELKAVIIGDPPLKGYDSDGKPLSNGLPYSVYPGKSNTRAMRNIRAKLKEDFGKIMLPVDSLEYIAKQGVLLIGSSLTRSPTGGGTHDKAWAGFINRLLKYIVELNEDVVYCLMGNGAKPFQNSISSSVDVIVCDSPVDEKKRNTFIESFSFCEINIGLESTNQESIDWELKDPDENRKRINLEDINYHLI